MNKMLPVSQENFDRLARAVVAMNQKIDSLTGLKFLMVLVLLGEGAILGVIL